MKYHPRPVDLSDAAAELCVSEAGALAGSVGARVLLLHVVPPPAVINEYAAGAERLAEEEKREAERSLEHWQPAPQGPGHGGRGRRSRTGPPSRRSWRRPPGPMRRLHRHGLPRPRRPLQSSSSAAPPRRRHPQGPLPRRDRAQPRRRRPTPAAAAQQDLMKSRSRLPSCDRALPRRHPGCRRAPGPSARQPASTAAWPIRSAGGTTSSPCSRSASGRRRCARRCSFPRLSWPP